MPKGFLKRLDGTPALRGAFLTMLTNGNQVSEQLGEVQGLGFLV
jgi:hypothetical protein